MLATYPAVFGLDRDRDVFTIIFFTVLLTTLLQGSTIGWIARLLRLTVPVKPHSPFSMELHATRESELDMFEIRLEGDAVANGRRIRELGLPADALISSIVRNGATIAPKGATVLKADDLLFVLARTSTLESLSASLNERHAPRRRRARPRTGPRIWLTRESRCV